ncbi:MAG: glycosyltransferase family 4 protein, partial [Stenotrophobium sp.]
PQDVEIYEAPLKPLPRFLLKALWLTLQQARQWHPDVVLAGSGLTAPLAWLAARVCGAKVVTYVHGLDISVPHQVYRRLWLPALRRMDRVIANSSATAELARCAGIDPLRIGIVHPGVTLPQNEYDPEAAARFRTEHGFGGRLLLLSVGRLTRRKGLREFVTDVLPRVIAHHPDVLLLVVGDAATNALYSEAQTPQLIQAVANDAGVGEHIRFLGKLSETDLLAAYQAADIHVFPVQHVPGDPEGFGMVAVEAAAHGLPTVAIATGGVVDAVADRRSGRLIAPGDSIALADAIAETLSTRNAMRESCIKFAQAFAWPRFGEAMIGQLDTIARVKTQ